MLLNLFINILLFRSGLKTLENRAIIFLIAIEQGGNAMAEEKENSTPEAGQSAAFTEQTKDKVQEFGKKLSGFFGGLAEKAKKIDVKELAEKAKNIDVKGLAEKAKNIDVKGLAEKAKSIDVKALAEKAKNDVKGLAERVKKDEVAEPAKKDAADGKDKPQS